MVRLQALAGDTVLIERLREVRGKADMSMKPHAMDMRLYCPIWQGGLSSGQSSLHNNAAVTASACHR
jgi:hypothetical protein